jgi:DNA-binding response OmpR family regulator
MTAGDLRLDPASRWFWRGETVIVLSTEEFALLEALMRRPGDIVTRYQLLEPAWDYDYDNRSNVVDVYIRYLREKSIARSIRRRARQSGALGTDYAPMVASHASPRMARQPARLERESVR